MNQARTGYGQALPGLFARLWRGIGTPGPAANPLLTRYQLDDAASGESPHLVRRHHPLLLGVVAQPGPDSGQKLIGVLRGPEVVQADHERVAEPALVRGMRGRQREVGRPRRVRVQSGGGLGGQRLGAVGRGQVVTGLVGGGEQCVQVRVRPVLRQPLGPAAAAEAPQQAGLRLGGGRGVEGAQAERAGRGPAGAGSAALDGDGCLPGGRGRMRGEAGVGLAGPGQRGLLESAASVNLEWGGTGETRWMQGEGRDECASKLTTRGNGRPTDARISPGRESFTMSDGRVGEENARLSQLSTPLSLPSALFPPRTGGF